MKEKQEREQDMASIKKLRRKTLGREEGGRPGRVTRKPNIVGPCPHRFREQEHWVKPQLTKMLINKASFH
jgi:hypothetical protein